MKKPFLSSGSVMNARNFEGRTSRFFSSIACVNSPTNTGITFYEGLFRPTTSHFAPLHRTKKRLNESAVGTKTITGRRVSKQKTVGLDPRRPPPTEHMPFATCAWAQVRDTP